MTVEQRCAERDSKAFTDLVSHIVRRMEVLGLSLDQVKQIDPLSIAPNIDFSRECQEHLGSCESCMVDLKEAVLDRYNE